MTSFNTDRFKFGIEAQFMLARATDCRPLWVHDVDAEQLLDIIDSIDTDHLPIDGFTTKPLHRRPSHFLVDGYTLMDAEMQPMKLLPKGIEIRTPACSSIDKSVEMLQDLHVRMNGALRKCGLTSAIVSHHPEEVQFVAPRNNAQNDLWQAALVATTTYGPDINISLPSDQVERVNREELHEKINYYMPALVALSLNSSIVAGALWMVRKEVGKSIYTYRRSMSAPLYMVHQKPQLRFEFKGFEIAERLDDYAAYFLMCLALLLDDKLRGRASDQTRVFDLRACAVMGLASEWVRTRGMQVIESAARIGSGFGFDIAPLDEMARRIDRRCLPADDLAQQFIASNNSIRELIASRQSFIPRRTNAPFVAPVRVDLTLMQQLPVLAALR